MVIATITLELHGVRFRATADFGNDDPLPVTSNTAHGALHALAAKVEGLSEGRDEWQQFRQLVALLDSDTSQRMPSATLRDARQILGLET